MEWCERVITWRQRMSEFCFKISSWRHRSLRATFRQSLVGNNSLPLHVVLDQKVFGNYTVRTDQTLGKKLEVSSVHQTWHKREVSRTFHVRILTWWDGNRFELLGCWLVIVNHARVSSSAGGGFAAASSACLSFFSLRAKDSAKASGVIWRASMILRWDTTVRRTLCEHWERNMHYIIGRRLSGLLFIVSGLHLIPLCNDSLRRGDISLPPDRPLQHFGPVFLGQGELITQISFSGQHTQPHIYKRHLCLLPLQWLNRWRASGTMTWSDALNWTLPTSQYPSGGAA